MELRGRVGFEDYRAGGGCGAQCERRRGRQAGHLGEPGAAGLLGGLAGGGAPLGQGLVAALSLPFRDRAGCGPGDYRVDADLGHQLDGELAAVALG
jgi:hypothetical protein